MRILVTGTAGFVGFHLARRLIAAGHEVAGVDGFTPYYDPELKRARHALLKGHNGFSEHVFMLEEDGAMATLGVEFRPEVIVHLAAQAGVRYSLENPRAYIDANVVGTFNVMEAARAAHVRHFLLASTSSAYGATEHLPFEEGDAANHPLTLYAATKKAGELMSHAYAHLWDLPTTAFRFFTVYGPWGRPDMALFKFVEAIEAGQPIDVYGHGRMTRDFTYIDDIVSGLESLIDHPPQKGRPVAAYDSLSPVAPWRLVNIGAGQPQPLEDFIAAIETALGKVALRNSLPMQPGDAPATFADRRLLAALIGERPVTPMQAGVARFVEWWRAYRD